MFILIASQYNVGAAIIKEPATEIIVSAHDKFSVVEGAKVWWRWNYDDFQSTG